MDSQKLYSLVRQAVDRYLLIEPGDHIAVGVSGGKDSMILLYALAGLRYFYPSSFKLSAITIDLGFGMDYTPISDFCQKYDIPYHIIQTSISEIVFSEKKSKNPCSLCATLRRGALVNAAKDLGCTKIALGHHKDDIIHTMMMSMIYEGRFYSISPYTAYEDSNMALIRPMIYLSEGQIRSFAEKMQLPIVSNLCPNDGHSARNDMKELTNELSARYPGIRRQFFHAIETGSIDDWVEARKRKEK